MFTKCFIRYYEHTEIISVQNLNMCFSSTIKNHSNNNQTNVQWHSNNHQSQKPRPLNNLKRHHVLYNKI